MASAAARLERLLGERSPDLPVERRAGHVGVGRRRDVGTLLRCLEDPDRDVGELEPEPASTISRAPLDGWLEPALERVLGPPE